MTTSLALNKLIIDSISILDINLQPVSQGVVGGVYLKKELLGNDDNSLSYLENIGGFIRTGDRGRWLSNGNLEIMDLHPEGLVIGNQYILIRQLELLILQLSEISGCVLLNLRHPKKSLNAYFLSENDFEIDILKSKLTNFIPVEILRHINFAQVAFFPYSDSGEIDFVSLSKIKDLNSQWVQEVEALVQKLQVSESAVVVDEVAESDPHIHIANLLHVPQIISETENSVAASDDSTTASTDLSYISGGQLDLSKEDPKTLAEALLKICNIFPEKGILIGGQKDEFLSYPALYKKALRILNGLNSAGVTAGDKVILQLTGLDEYFPSFWACILGGIIPTTIAIPPSYAEENSVRAKLFSSFKFLHYPSIISSSSNYDELNKYLSESINTNFKQILRVDDLLKHVESTSVYDSKSNETAFFQLSSGSTGVPKCIQITHKGVIDYAMGSKIFNQYSSSDVTLNWMPFDHVGALIMFHLKDVCVGIHQIQLITTDVLFDPSLWLKYIEKFQVTHTWAPNFGYKLLADEIEKNDPLCNLSSVKTFLNGGEQVTIATVEKFLSLTKKYGVKPSNIQPAYGMAEVCTAITYENQLDEKGALPENTGIQNANSFSNIVSVGKPRPGVEIRIVDNNNIVLPQMREGRIQIKSTSLSPGYIDNEEENTKAFLEGNWYNTGDLGVINEGKLYVTGREKEMIIIRGTHYYYYEIEDLINKIDGVVPTFVGCISSKKADNSDEELSIFFSASASEFKKRMEVVKEITAEVTRIFGITPRHVVPMTKEDFPKTTSGKIQRTKLKEGLINGEYADVINAIEIFLKDPVNTTPDWYFKRTWLNRPASYPLSHRYKRLLIFQDGLDSLVSDLKNNYGFAHVVEVRSGDVFEKIDATTYKINPCAPQDFEKLYDCLEKDNLDFNVVLNWLYYKPIVRECSVELLKTLHKKLILSSTNIIRFVKKISSAGMRLFTITQNSLPVFEYEALCWEKAILSGLLKTAQQELNEISFTQLDFAYGEKNILQPLLSEIANNVKEPEVAIRNGQRCVSKLEKMDLFVEREKNARIKAEGIYLITGGLGGIGIELAQYLIKKYHLKLILIGRTKLDGSSHHEQLKRNQFFEAFQAHNENVLYRAVDVCDLNELRKLIKEAEILWGLPLSGIFHLAAQVSDVDSHWSNVDDKLTVNLGFESFEEIFHSKVYGLLTLNELIKEKSEVSLINFSSVNGFFGGYSFAPYSSACSFQSNFVSDLLKNNFKSCQTINWGMWSEIGINKRNSLKSISHNKGFGAMSLVQGLIAADLALQTKCSDIYIGIDNTKKEVQRYTEKNVRSKKKLTVCLSESEAKDESEIFEHFKRKFSEWEHEIMYFKQLPYKGGQVDKARLRQMIQSGSKGLNASNIEETNEEKVLISILKEVLNKSEIGVFHSFFELGGDSLRATKLISRIHQVMNVKVEIKDIFTHITVRNLARFIASSTKTYGSDIQLIAQQEFYEVSHAQKRLWILNQIEIDPVAYNIPISWIMKGDLNHDALKNSFYALVERHEGLRTIFEVIEGEVYQKIKPASLDFFDYSFQDLTGKPGSEEKANIMAFEHATKLFDLKGGPLFKILVIQVTDKKALVLCSKHHIISDGWSIGIFLNDLATIYNALNNGENVSLPPLQFQYKDYAYWQNRQLEGGNLNIHRNYWLSQFHDEVPVLHFPTTFNRPKEKGFRGRRKSFYLNQNLANGLREINGVHGTSLFMTLYSVVYILLHKYSGQDDIVIGTPIAGRIHQALERQIGFYVNTLALRNRICEQDTFLFFLMRVKENILNAYEHQIYPFDRLVDELDLPRRLNRSPLFDVLIALQNFENLDVNLTMPGIDIEPYSTDILTSKFDLSFYFKEAPKGIALSLEYSSALFDDQSIEVIWQHFENIVEEIVKNKSILISQINYIQQDERNKIIREFSTGTVRNLPFSGFAKLFEQQVEKYPSHTAVSDNSNKLTYQELNERANQLARFLQSQYDIRFNAVGIMVDRSVHMLIAMLALNKAGSTYVPLDPTYPKDRLIDIIENADISLVLTNSKFIALSDQLQWELPTFKTYVCIEPEYFYEKPSVIDQESKLMWNYTVQAHENEHAMSGGISSYTGEVFSDGEMQEFYSNVLIKLQPFLNKSTKVLEIGCGSGILMLEIAGRVGQYCGTDISENIIAKCEEKAQREKLDNVQLLCCSANDIDMLGDGQFDVIIVNSVIQYLDHQYLRNLLSKLNALASNEAKIFIGDVRDKELQLEFYKSLYGTGVAPDIENLISKKKNSENELLVDRRFFLDYYATSDFKVELSFSKKIGTIQNELSLYRYDVLISLEKSSGNITSDYQLHKQQVFSIDFNQFSNQNLAVDVASDDNMYILYTSGSTGKPKGVEISHKSVTNFFHGMSEKLNFSENDKMLALTSYTFDISVLELLFPLTSGGQVIILMDNEFKDPFKIKDAIMRYKPSFMQATPSLWKMLLSANWSGSSDLTILCGGEYMDSQLIVSLKERCTKLWNGYGPTETTIYSLMKLLENKHNVGSIGKPILNTNVYLLDKNNQPVPVGVVGEICISGMGLANGYRKQPHLTAEKFISHKFDNKETRLYKTGDLGKWSATGEVIFLGRNDTQVKIRGNRVELSEVEAALLKVPSISNGIAIVREESDHSSAIAAFYTSATMVESEVTANLSKLLPEYMIPSYCTRLEEIPLTANGKIDRKMLSTYHFKSSRSLEYVAPQNELEKKIVSIWESILDCKNIGMRDSFFELGGNSLRATRIVTMLHHELDIKIELRNIFTYPTIEKLVSFIDAVKWVSESEGSSVTHDKIII